MMNKGYKCSSSPHSAPQTAPPEGLVQLNIPPQCGAIELLLRLLILSAHNAFFAIFFRFACWLPKAAGRKTQLDNAFKHLSAARPPQDLARRAFVKSIWGSVAT